MFTRNPKCSSNSESFFASSQYPIIFTHTVTIISIPVGIYALYCLIYVTPNNMKSAKNHLLNIHFWTMGFDLIFNVLIVPIGFFPSASMATLGFGYEIGIPPRFNLYLIQSIVCVIGVTIVGLFENRFSLIHTNPYRIERKCIRYSIFILNYTLGFTANIPPYFQSPNLDSIRLDFLRSFPCPPKEFFSDKFTVITDDPGYVTIFMCIQCIIIIPQALFFSLYTAYILVLKPNHSVSAATRKMQITFLIAFVLQFTIPALLLCFPVFYVWFSVWANYYNMEYNNHLVILIGLHGFLSTLCVILIHKPYRIHLFSFFKPRPKSTLQVSGINSIRNLI
ncbi:unnamed protein product [Caenorhabditis angaria]|uniref:Serpentine Receptor, class H n=1 Tax=Caenorhabditis angaria TaxID=860376 RepID=A0A9P1N8D8_9PELO|nr:unnamed protein product [Caenorhabditis angaria]